MNIRVPEKPDESTDDLVLTISDSIGANLKLEEIDRSHRVARGKFLIGIR